MPKHFLFSPGLCFISALLVAAPVIAQAPAPSQEFWDYLSEYGDDNGNLLDPLEYDQILSMKESDDMDSKAASALSESEVLDMSKASSADMKIETKSSTQVSSSAVKGAAL